MVVLAAFLCGCPYESPYAIDQEPQQNIDENLIGKWVALVPKPSDDKHYKEDPVEIIFSKRTDMEYDIAITGYINELKPYNVIAYDSIKGTAFISSIGKYQFLNATIYGKVYIAELKQNADGISIIPLSEHFTAKYVKSSEALKAAIEFHYRTRPMPTYDDWFVLKNLQKVN
jgi:hypothetical protein